MIFSIFIDCLCPYLRNVQLAIALNDLLIASQLFSLNCPLRGFQHICLFSGTVNRLGKFCSVLGGGGGRLRAHEVSSKGLFLFLFLRPFCMPSIILFMIGFAFLCSASVPYRPLPPSPDSVASFYSFWQGGIGWEFLFIL